MIVLDSDVIVDALRGQADAGRLVTRLVERGEELATTSVNVAEIYRGAEGPSEEVEDLLDRLVVLPLDPGACRRYGSLMSALDRGGKPIPALDGLVAAITLEHGGRLATRNKRHFGRVAGLQLLDAS